MTHTTLPHVKMVATSQETSQYGYSVHMRHIPRPISPSEDDRGGVGVDEASSEGVMTRAWRPLRLSREDHCMAACWCGCCPETAC